MGEFVSGDSPIGDLSQNATLVIAGPPMTGKYTLMLTILAHYTDDTIVISTKHSAPRLIDDFENVSCGNTHRRIGIVDCVSQPEGVQAPETELVKHAGSPDNLTRIGVKFTELFEQFFQEDSTSQTGVGLHSISQLLMHTELKSTYQFLQVLTGQVRSANWLCIAVVDTNIDEEQLQTIYHHFDGIVQTRENDEGRRELRVRGLSPTSSEWTTF